LKFNLRLGLGQGGGLLVGVRPVCFFSISTFFYFSSCFFFF
jgi:hypothetical protein